MIRWTRCWDVPYRVCVRLPTIVSVQPAVRAGT